MHVEQVSMARTEGVLHDGALRGTFVRPRGGHELPLAVHAAHLAQDAVAAAGQHGLGIARTRRCSGDRQRRHIRIETEFAQDVASPGSGSNTLVANAEQKGDHLVVLQTPRFKQ